MTLNNKYFINSMKNESTTRMPYRTPLFCIAAIATAVQFAYAVPMATQPFMPTTYTSSVANPAAVSNSVILFVDSRVPDSGQLLANRAVGVEVVYLNPQEDGLLQISRILEHRNNIQSIQIISHGNAGQLQLGNGFISSSNLTTYTNELHVIKQSLQQGGDILLLGCNVGAGQKGH